MSSSLKLIQNTISSIFLMTTLHRTVVYYVRWTFSTYNYSRFIWISCTEQCIFKSYLSRKSFLIVMISEEGPEEDRRRLSRAPPGLTLLYSTKELILRNCCSIIKRSLLIGRTYAQQHDLYIQLIINDLWLS